LRQFRQDLSIYVFGK